MENLIKKLQEEAGLTEQQAVESIAIIKDYIDKEGVEIDWNKFFKGKYEEFKEKSKNFYENASKQSQTYTDKFIEKVDGLATKARKGAHDISQKAADFFDDKEQ